MKKNEILVALFISKKNIMRNKASIFLTTLIIALGFILSVLIYGVLNDTGHDMQENFIETLTGHIVIEPYDQSSKIENANFMLKKIRNIPEVIGVSKVNVRVMTLIDKGRNSKGVEVYIIDPNQFSDTSEIDDLIVDGSFLNKGEKGDIVLGCLNVESCNEIKAYDSLDLDIGRKVLVYLGEDSYINLTLSGVYHHKFVEVEIIGFINEDTASDIYSDFNKDNADFIMIRLSDRKYTQEIISELNNLNLNAKIYDWEEKSSRHNSIIDSFLIVGDLSFFIGVIISAISLYIVLYINILNKKAQIGIIRAIGIKSKVISLSYVFLSFFIGVIGCIFGIFLTLICIKYFEFYPIVTGVGDLVPSVSLEKYLLVSVAMIFASLISGYLVSKRIAKKNIIGSIQNG